MDRKGLIIGSLGLLSAAYIYSSLSWARYLKKRNTLKVMKPSEIYDLWDKVVREEITLGESGITYEVVNSVGEGSDVIVQGDVLLIPRYLYDEVANSFNAEAEDEKEYCILCNSYDTEMQGEKHFEQYLSREHEAHKISLKLAKALEKMHHEIYINSKEAMLLNVEVIEYDGPGEDDVDANWWTDDWGPEISRDIDPSNLIYDLPQAYVYEKYSDSPTKALARYDEAKITYYPSRKYGFPIIEISIPNHNKGYKNNKLIIRPIKG